MRWWCAGALLGLGFACAGPPSPVPPVEPVPVPPPPEPSYFGLSLGAPESVLTALPGGVTEGPDGAKSVKFDQPWRGRAWHVMALARGGKIVAITASTNKDDPEGPLTDVMGWAASVCKEFVPDGTRRVGWNVPPNKRYTQPLSASLAIGAAEATCDTGADGDLRLAGAAADAAIVLVEQGAAQQPAWVAAVQNALPFAWDTAPFVGQPIDADGLRFVIGSVQEAAVAGANPYLRQRAARGAFFVVIRYTIENTSPATSTVVADQLAMTDLQGRVFSPSSKATLAVAADLDVDVLLSELQPGVPREQVAVFELPEADRSRIDLRVPGGADLPFTFTP